ncbi:hypothetical protein [Antribacter gilvus]|uniref:hypothetical protein n=1 Tax=Antribacter gilvus TaxID=2304675 RepID=UPI000F76FC1D|nr:hypothetical protein [Antribacter gilvus]
MTDEAAGLQRRIRAWLIVFIVGLALSGLTAFPMVTEVRLLDQMVTAWRVDEWLPPFAEWITRVRAGYEVVAAQHPFILYGTDWLAFAHLVIAVAFWGPYRDPVRNVWVVQFGLIACAGVIPLAVICGPIRGIPWGWTLIDMSFGVFGAIPLWIVLRMIRRLEAMLREAVEPVSLRA